MVANSAQAMEVLKKPDFVFEGLSRDGQEKGRCYVGRPSTRAIDRDSSMPTTPDDALIVFHTEEDFLYEWRWISLQRERQPSLLDYCKDTFETQLWPKT